VVGTAENGERALEMLDKLKPDLVILDVNMPVMNGSTALKHIMIKSPCPVLIMSNLGDGSHKEIIEFLNLGAVDFMRKPVQNKHIFLQQQKIVERILQAAGARTNCFKRIRVQRIIQKQKVSIDQNSFPNSMLIISAGAGGHSVMLELISRLPADLSHCVLILQTIPPILTKAIADYLNERSHLEVTPLKGGKTFQTGQCFFTGHGNKITVYHKENENEISVESSDTIQSVSNSFDELLFSMVDSFKDKIQIVLLSGSEIGTLNGLKKVRSKGGKIIIQKRHSCVVSTSLEKIIEEELFDMELDIDSIAKEVSKTIYSKVTFRPS
jgi:two-component system chemotaxis response regulator CheB